MNRNIRIVLAGAVLWGGLALAQDQDMRPVQVGDLVSSPQKYWARSFVFADTLVRPPAGGAVKLAGRRYVSFFTQEAGRCYVLSERADLIASLPLNRRYHFIGTVLNHGRRYFIVIRGVSAAVEQGEVRLDWLKPGESPAEHMKNQALRPLLEILTTAEAAHVGYAEAKGVALADLYNPQSPHYNPALGLMRTSVAAYEQKAKLSASEMLAQYLFQILVARHPASEAAPAGPAVPEVAPAEDTKPPAELQSGAEETPRRLTFWERRRLARQQKAAAAEERKRQEAAGAYPAAETVPLPPAAGIPAPAASPEIGEEPVRETEGNLPPGADEPSPPGL